jgi:hypothetical protein
MAFILRGPTFIIQQESFHFRLVVSALFVIQKESRRCVFVIQKETRRQDSF